MQHISRADVSIKKDFRALKKENPSCWIPPVFRAGCVFLTLCLARSYSTSLYIRPLKLQHRIKTMHHWIARHMLCCSKFILCGVSVSNHQGSSVSPPAGQIYVGRERRGQKRFPWWVPRQPEAGAKQEQGNERKHQEVPGRGQKTGGVGRIDTSSKEIC